MKSKKQCQCGFTSAEDRSGLRELSKCNLNNNDSLGNSKYSHRFVTHQGRRL